MRSQFRKVRFDTLDTSFSLFWRTVSFRMKRTSRNRALLRVDEGQHTSISFSSPGKNIHEEWKQPDNQTRVLNWSTPTGKPLTREGSTAT